MKLFATILFSVLLSTHFVFGQQNKDEVYYRNVFFKDAFFNKDYETAVREMDWLLANDPNLKESVFVKGVKALDEMMSNTQDPVRKEELQNKSLDLYRVRFARFGQDPKVKNLELTTAYRYWIVSSDKHLDLFNRFKSNLVGEKMDNISNPNLLAYMDVIRRVSKSEESLADEFIILEYNRISSTMESRKEMVDDSDIYIPRVDAIFLEIVNMSCDRLETNFGSQLIEEGIEDSKLYLRLALKFGCTKNTSFEKALDNVLVQEPTLNLLHYKAKWLMSQNRFGEAEEMFGKALMFDTDSEVEGEIYLDLAKIYAIKEEKAQARSYALKSIAKNGNREAHSIIGGLYMSSFSECAEGKDIVERRAVYIAAFEQFKLANDTKNMMLAKQNFPSGDEIFFNLYRLGQEIEVDCWFKEIVKLDKRD